MIPRLSPHDCTYRIYRDVRFSNDKRPYKLHMGAYINSHGKKSMHGGYYIHFQPGNCFAAGGCYCLDNKTLKAIRESIVDNLDEFRNIVEKNEFKSLFPVIGEERLKNAPKGFPKDFQYLSYLQPKDYSVSTPVDDDLLLSKGWEEKVVEIFSANYFALLLYPTVLLSIGTCLGVSFSCSARVSLSIVALGQQAHPAAEQIRQMFWLT